MKKYWPKVKQYALNWAILLDLAFNTLLGGTPRETLSSRMGKAVEDGRCVLCKLTCNVLHLFDKDHCKNSIDPNRGEGTPGDRNVAN